MSNTAKKQQTPWQPTLEGETLLLRPLDHDDFKDLFQAASDPLIWEQHPDRERYTLERFKVYFDSGMASRGALAVIDKSTGRIIGSSRYSGYKAKEQVVEIGYTFLTRAYWGTHHNTEMKLLMINHAFQFVETIFFLVGRLNLRSRRAMIKLGATEISDQDASNLPIPAFEDSVIYRIQKFEWQR